MVADGIVENQVMNENNKIESSSVELFVIDEMVMDYDRVEAPDGTCTITHVGANGTQTTYGPYETFLINGV